MEKSSESGSGDPLDFRAAQNRLPPPPPPKWRSKSCGVQLRSDLISLVVLPAVILVLALSLLGIPPSTNADNGDQGVGVVPPMSNEERATLRYVCAS